MSTPDRLRLVAPCGIDCGNCLLHACGNNQDIISRLVSRGIPREKIPCAGCRTIEGSCPVIPEPCETYACVRRRGVEFCSECGDFPCSRLCPSSDRADVLPHNLKVFNLCTIERMGVEGFVELSGDTERRYFKGSMHVGRGPRIQA